MGLRAVNLLRENIRSLLRARGTNQKELSFFLRRHPTTINKFLKGTREVQLADLDRMADFFGLATYQLFQPGISPLTERRSGKERRKLPDRRIGYAAHIAPEPPRGPQHPRLSDEDRDLLDRFHTLPEPALEAIKLLMSAHLLTQPDAKQKPRKTARRA
jgi:transcriptional regulator with XRE-family HTH domain